MALQAIGHRFEPDKLHLGKVVGFRAASFNEWDHLSERERGGLKAYGSSSSNRYDSGHSWEPNNRLGFPLA